MWESNEFLFTLIHGLAHQIDYLDALFVILASILPFFVVTIGVIHSFRLHDIQKEFRELFWLFIPAFSAFVLTILIKSIVSFPRPYAYAFDVAPLITVSDPFGSFPSSHAATFAAFGFALYLHDHHFGRAFIFAAGVIGLARIAVGVHWPFDVFVGFFLGLLVAFIIRQIEMRFVKKNSSK